jgi:hypothetical protein
MNFEVLIIIAGSKLFIMMHAGYETYVCLC